MTVATYKKVYIARNKDKRELCLFFHGKPTRNFPLGHELSSRWGYNRHSGHYNDMIYIQNSDILCWPEVNNLKWEDEPLLIDITIRDEK